jgi:Domain of Unknown Function with PDB structure (DUF3857)/Transglutaminase-like superfamily
MRLHILLRSTFILLVAASPLLLRAQFQDPTPDELKMTSDPKAPGAQAVYLYREETTDDERHIHTYYSRIKVLADKGKELATVRIPYERGESKVEHIEGRTIHSDGTVIPLTVKPDDLVDIKTKHLQVDTILFNLPSVDVGSILEYRLQVRYNSEIVSSPTWHLQQPYFVHKEHFMFHPLWRSDFFIRNDRGQTLNQLMWAMIGPPDQVAVHSNKNFYTVDLADVPPVPDDDWMPPMNFINWKVEFYYTYATTMEEYWGAEEKWWALGVNAFIEPTNTLKKAVAEVVSPSDSDEQKARKIYAAVTRLDNTDLSREKSKAERKKEKVRDVNSVEDIWKNQSGTGNSLALLYAAMARAAGLKAWPARIVDRDDAIFDKSNLSTGQLDDYVVRLVIAGKDVWVDPGEKMCPFGELLWTHALAGGLVLKEAGADTGYTPAATYKENDNTRTADLTVDAQGGVTGSARVILYGADAIYWRQLALREGDDAAKKEFTDSLRDDFPDGIEVDFDHFLSLDDPEKSLMAVVNISGSLGTPAGKRLIVPGLFFETRAKHPFVAQNKRTVPIDLRYPKMEQDSVTFHLPPGYTMESSPYTNDVKWPGFAALGINSVVKKDGSLEVVRIFARNFTWLKPETYNDLRDFYLKLAAADQQQIVLVRATPPKGN